jgi:hypothetical protein
LQGAESLSPSLQARHADHPKIIWFSDFRKKNALDRTFFITNRCEHEMFFLLPTDRIAEIIQCCFARALCLYGQGLEIYGFIFFLSTCHVVLEQNGGSSLMSFSMAPKK